MLLCGEIPYNNEDDGPIFSMAEVPIDGIVSLARCCTLSFSERNVPFPGEQHCFTCTCFTALDVHVSQLYMYMFYIVPHRPSIGFVRTSGGFYSIKIYLKKSRLSDYTISSRICLLYKPEYFDLCILCFEIPALLFFPY